MTNELKDPFIADLFTEAAGSLPSVDGPGPADATATHQRRRRRRRVALVAMAVLAVAVPLGATLDGDPVGVQVDAADRPGTGSPERASGSVPDVDDRPGAGALHRDAAPLIYERIPGREPNGGDGPPPSIDPDLRFEVLFTDPADDIRACRPTSGVVPGDDCGSTLGLIDIVEVSAALDADANLHLRLRVSDLGDDPRDHPEMSDRIVEKSWAELTFLDPGRRSILGFQVMFDHQIAEPLDPDDRDRVGATLYRAQQGLSDPGSAQLREVARLAVAEDLDANTWTVRIPAAVLADHGIDPRDAWTAPDRSAHTGLEDPGVDFRGGSEPRDDEDFAKP